MSFLLLYFSGVRGWTSFAWVKRVNRWISSVVLRLMGQVIDTTVSRIFLLTHVIIWLPPMKSSHLRQSVTLRRSSRRSKTVLPTSVTEFVFSACHLLFNVPLFFGTGMAFACFLFLLMLSFFLRPQKITESQAVCWNISYVMDLNTCTVYEQCTIETLY